MKLGISTACYYPLETEKALVAVGESEAGTAEIFFNAASELEPSFIKELMRIREYYGILITSVHPAMSFADSFMIYSAYERRLKEGLDMYRRYGEIASLLGAKYIIMHGGKPNGVLNEEEYCERFYMTSCAAAESGAVVLQENVVNFRAGDPAFIKTMKDILGENAAFCLDIKQSIRALSSPYEIMDIAGSTVKHLHLSDNTPENDCLLPGRGSFDFVKFIEYAHKKGFSGDGVIEVYKNAYQNYGEIQESLKILKKDLKNSSLNGIID